MLFKTLNNNTLNNNFLNSKILNSVLTVYVNTIYDYIWVNLYSTTTQKKCVTLL